MEEKDKRVKREIANSNERRRMQSINAGFQKLKRLLPVDDGEKISKAAILQHASDYVQQIEREKLVLFEQNTLMREILINIKNGADVTSALQNFDLDAKPIKPRANIEITTTTPTVTTLSTSPMPSSTTSSPSPSITSGTTPTPATNTTLTTTPTTATTNNSQVARNPSLNNTSNTLNSNNDRIMNIDKDDKTTKSSLTNRDIPKSRSGRNGNNKDTSGKNCIHSSNSTNAHSTSSDRNTCQELTNQQTDASSDRVSTSPKNVIPAGGIAKAAIALPLDVPYISDTAIRVEQHHIDLHSDISPPATRKKLKAQLASAASVDGQEPRPKVQTLDTICEAIKEIEGERVFKIERIKHDATT